MKKVPGGPAQQLSLLDLTDCLAPARLLTEAEFIARLTARLKSPMRIVLTKNRSSIISVKAGPDGTPTARIQDAFRAADDRTIQALAQFLTRPTPRSRELIDAFLREHRDLVEAVARDVPPARPGPAKGNCYDLTRVLAKIMRDYGFRVPGVMIAWSVQRPSRRRRRSSIKFGSYCKKTKTIRVHPALDSAEVPEFFVEYIVYHELLHALFPPQAGLGARREIHTEEFKRFEEKFSRYREAREYERLFVRTKLG